MHENFFVHTVKFQHTCSFLMLVYYYSQYNYIEKDKSYRRNTLDLLHINFYDVIIF